MFERAILDAALDQLGTVGWNGLTRERVAVGAQTGEAAVYRRRPFREYLVADAQRAGLPGPDAAPDPGSVREDLSALTRRARDARCSRPGSTPRSIIHECDPNRMERFHALIIEGFVESAVQLLCEVFRWGIERGEARSGAANGCVPDAAAAMMMCRSRMCGSEGSDR